MTSKKQILDDVKIKNKEGFFQKILNFVKNNKEKISIQKMNGMWDLATKISNFMN